MEQFASKFRELKEEKGLKQTEIAQKLNTTQQTIGRWLKGYCEPDIENLIELAQLFNCSVDYLIGRESEDGIIVVSGNELSKDEEHLLDITRQLPPKEKDMVYRLAETLYEYIKK